MNNKYVRTTMLTVLAVWSLHFSFSAYTYAQSPNEKYRTNWSKPAEPLHIIGNIYYVGATGISSYIISTSKGLILLDSGTLPMLPIIKGNIEKLGFSITDVKYIISSHAHWDHVEGHAQMKRLTGADIVALGEDAAAIASGIDSSALKGEGWEPVKVDHIIEDGDTLSLGDVTLTAHLTPGHTKGCTTWTTTITENHNKSYKIVFVGGTSINSGVKLLNNERHPQIAEDYSKTIKLLKSLNPDVFLAQHPSMYTMKEKRALLSKGVDKNPFLNRDEYKSFLQSTEAKYLTQLNRENNTDK